MFNQQVNTDETDLRLKFHLFLFFKNKNKNIETFRFNSIDIFNLIEPSQNMNKWSIF